MILFITLLLTAFNLCFCTINVSKIYFQCVCLIQNRSCHAYICTFDIIAIVDRTCMRVLLVCMLTSTFNITKTIDGEFKVTGLYLHAPIRHSKRSEKHNGQFRDITDIKITSVAFSLTMERKVAATFMVFSMPLVNSSNGQPKHFSPLLNSELSDPPYFYKSDDDQKLVNSVSKDRQKHTCTCSTIHQCVTV